MNVTLEYIAGFFDGEGCVVITKDKKTNNRMKNGWSLNPYIILTQKKPNILKEIQKTFKNYNIKSDLYSIKGGNLYRLRIIGTKKIIDFCNLMLPHLICKKQELQIMKNAMEYRISKSGRKDYTNKDIEFYESLRSQKDRDYIIDNLV